jgi:DNA-binding NarL/FixJ family response regulator
MATLLDKLTKRDLQILLLLSQGFTDPMIADSLVISVNTVKTHLKIIYSQLQIEKGKNRRVLAARAYLKEMVGW